MAIRDALIDRSYPNWALAAALAIAFLAEAARHLMNAVMIADNPATPSEIWPYTIASIGIQVASCGAIAWIVVATRHLSAPRGALFAIGLVLINEVAPLIFAPPGLSVLLAVPFLFWALPTALLFGLAALCGAFARARPLARLLGLVAAGVGFSWLITDVLGSGLAFMYGSPGQIIANVLRFAAPVISEFLFVLVCLEFFAPFRADEARA